jgi:hypothetical protein
MALTRGERRMILVDANVLLQHSWTDEVIPF